MHVYIESGLKYLLSKGSFEQLHLLEMGFGTGLNVFLTAIETESSKQKIHYTTVEQFPLDRETLSCLNYTEYLGHERLFHQLHESNWMEDIIISDYFKLRKENVSLLDYSTSQQFNLIYYDAFAPAAQPELWTKEIFEQLFHLLQHNGILVTYCSKGDVRRAMQAAGFTVTKLPGPPGKREILRAMKL